MDLNLVGVFLFFNHGFYTEANLLYIFNLILLNQKILQL